MIDCVAVLNLNGAIRGGKNNYIVLRNGKHIPTARFTSWKKQAYLELLPQLKTIATPLPLDNPYYLWIFEYTPPDNRKRDITAILDSLFNLFEAIHLVKDDSIIKNVFFIHKRFTASKPKSGVKITILNLKF